MRKHVFVRVLLLLIFVGLFGFSSREVFQQLYTEQHESQAFEALSAQVRMSADAMVAAGGIDVNVFDAETDSVDELSMLAAYAPLYSQNQDLFGWIRIDDTVIDYPVMYTPDDPEYYLHRAFDRSESASGTPFMAGSCYEGCGNYIIYGHHMKNGAMFASIVKYVKEEYWREHPSIQFDTLYESCIYDIVGCFYSKVYRDDGDGFAYYNYTDLSDPDVFDEYVSKVREAALYDTGVSAVYGDQLITLSTCEYSVSNGRFVVVARRH